MTCPACEGKGVLSIHNLGQLGMLPAKDHPLLVRAPTGFPSWYCILYCWIPGGAPKITEDAEFRRSLHSWFYYNEGDVAWCMRCDAKWDGGNELETCPKAHNRVMK